MPRNFLLICEINFSSSGFFLCWLVVEISGGVVEWTCEIISSSISVDLPKGISEDKMLRSHVSWKLAPEKYIYPGNMATNPRMGRKNSGRCFNLIFLLIIHIRIWFMYYDQFCLKTAFVLKNIIMVVSVIFTIIKHTNFSLTQFIACTNLFRII